jgi:hypothetical protein
VASPATSAASAPNGGPGASRAWLTDVGALCLLKAALGAWLLASGFSHVSDDDYARTVIAEQFAHAPRLDPSGTSWLPLPFWVAGLWMMAVGRSLASARTIAFVLGVFGVAAPYAAMRGVGVSRAASVTSVAVAMAIPWNAWLGVATVPDGWSGALLAAGAIAMNDASGGSPRRRAWAAAALLAASSSRYEAWPVCGLFVVQSTCRVLVSLRAAPSRPRTAAVRRELGLALLAAAGPLLWMGWNTFAHGSPFHFIARVTTFRRAIGAANITLHDKLVGYPVALVEETPEVVALALAAVVGAIRSREVRLRWAWPAAAAGLVMAFLVAGDLGDGAPTHHPARALASVWWIATGIGVDVLAAASRRSGGRAWRYLGIAAAIAWGLSLRPRWREWPGQGPSERRDVQIARGLDLRARRVAGADVTPCSFEHFALLAAWGAPERATVAPRTGAAPTSDCPRVTER